MRLINILILIFLVSCASTSEVQESNSPYFSIAPFLTKEKVDGLKGAKKTVSFNQQKETKHLNLDEIKKSLEILKELDLTSPRLLNAYSVEQNNSTVTYIRSDGDENGISDLTLMIKDDRLSLQASSREKNLLYEYRRTFSASFSQDSVLTSYTVSGTKKILGYDQRDFSVTVDYLTK